MLLSSRTLSSRTFGPAQLLRCRTRLTTNTTHRTVVSPSSLPSTRNTTFITTPPNSPGPLIPPRSRSRSHFLSLSRIARLRTTAVRPCSYRHHNMCRSLDTGAEGGSTPVPARELLPTNVKPRHYHLTLEPDFEKFTFEGIVVIDLDVVEASNSISLHTLDLTIRKAAIRSGDETVAAAPTLTAHEPSQVTRIDFTGTLAKDAKAQLEIHFTGQLNDKMAGFYRSTWKKPDGSVGIMASTQMEATDARRAFPCFDEPALKAEFTVTLIADKKLTCLSNMDVASESDIKSSVTGTAKRSVTFNRSPAMSTYLIAWVIGELDCIETDQFRVPIRVFCPAGQDIENGRFSLDLAAKTLVLYEKLFGIEFPLPKMDQVAIPDFAQGAMENWGLVTYRNVDLMLDEKASGAATKTRVATVVVHELAHQWFGNLVTMDWWEGLWLNEGFAEWVSTYAINKFFPEWKVWEVYVTEDLQYALSLDSLRSSHPIEVPVKRADEINQIFDSISYSKGSCVLRMIATWLGEDVFLEGVRRYLKKHAWGNTTTSDLWASLSEASGKNVDEIMTVWTKRVGYPVVTVTEKDNGTIHLKQNRFLRAGDTKPEEDTVLYPIMLGIRTKEGVNKDAMLLGREAGVKVPTEGFYKINADHTGLFRTSYPPDRLEKLGEAAKKEGLLTVMDKTGMIADTGALATSGYQKTSGALSLLKGFKAEKEFVVWSEIVSRVAMVESAWIFGDGAIRHGLEAFRRDLVSEKAHELGWTFSDKDDHVLQQFKAMMFGSAGIAGDETIVKDAKAMFTKYMAGDKTAIHPNIRASVFGMVLKFGGKEEYDAILKFYHASTNSDERNTALRSLGRARDPELIQRTLSLLTDPSVKDQDIYMPASSLRSHPEGIEALFGWMTQHWDELVKRLPPALPMLSSMVSILTSSLTTADQLAAVQGFFKGRSTEGFDQSLAQSLDSIRAKVAWVGRDDDDVREWLKSNGYIKA